LYVGDTDRQRAGFVDDLELLRKLFWDGLRVRQVTVVKAHLIVRVLERKTEVILAVITELKAFAPTINLHWRLRTRGWHRILDTTIVHIRIIQGRHGWRISIRIRLLYLYRDIKRHALRVSIDAPFAVDRETKRVESQDAGVLVSLGNHELDQIEPVAFGAHLYTRSIR